MRLCLGIPYYGACHALFFKAIQNLHRTPPCPFAIVDVIGDSLVPRARNTLTWRFMQSTDFDHLLFIDSDIIFTPGHVEAIIAHDTTRYPVIGGLYPKKKVEPNWVLNTFEGGPNQPGEDGLLPVKYAGTGFLLVTRKILEEIAERWPERRYQSDSDEEGDYRYDYFPIGPRNSIVPDAPDLAPGEERYLSEDWAFCELVRALGYPVVVDTRVRLEHQGMVHYPIAADQVLPRQALQDMAIGQRCQSHLSNVQVFEANGAFQGKRLIDVDALVGALNPTTSNHAAA